ncbi:MAG: alpha/beta hydrolase [Candidatus Rokuibacteriota bacterium]
MPTLDVDDRRLSYEETGAGPVALLVHGSPGNARAWARVGERLAGRFRVIAPDLPGYGETTHQPEAEGPDVTFGCELIEALVRYVGPPAVLAGHSYGGVVALAVGLRGRVPVGALALFEPVAVPALAMAGEPDAYAAAKTVFDDYIARAGAGDHGAVRTMVDFWFGAGAFARMPEPLTAYMMKETASNVRDVTATFRQRYSVEALGKLRMPVTMVVGARSPEVTRRIAQAIARHVPHGSVQTLEGANHALTTTHADAVAEAIAGAASRG